MRGPFRLRFVIPLCIILGFSLVLSAWAAIVIPNPAPDISKEETLALRYNCSLER